MSAAHGGAVVIGVGNEWRHDDGIGWVVARAAAVALGGAAELVLTDGEPARLLDAWHGVGLAVVIDAVRTGAPPGTVCVLDLADVLGAAPSGRAPGASHSLGLRAAAQLGQALDRLPDQLVVVGVEGEDLGAGRGLSAAVHAAVRSAVVEVCRSVTGHQREQVGVVGELGGVDEGQPGRPAPPARLDP
jgi:hydrogenase maturation protease